MQYRRKSPYECSVEELDLELIARGVRIPEQQRFLFDDREGTPARDAAMAQVKEFYHQAASLSPDAALRHISTWELAEALVYMTEGVSLDHTRAISGSDDRKDIFQLKDNPANEPIKKNARSVAAICMEEDLIDQDNRYSTLEHKNYGKTFNLCRCEPFYQQPVAAGHLFSGFLVKEDVIATAGHCVNENNVKSIRIVFGFRMKDAATAVTRVPNKDIYKGVKIIHRYHNRMGNGSDWALVQLDRNVKGRQVVKFPETEISTCQPVYVIGHPCGLPLKYSAGAEVRKIKDAYFVADLDIYAGSSGSPIFDKNTHEVIGMVVRGYHRDFRWTGKCYISVKLPPPGMNSLNKKFFGGSRPRGAGSPLESANIKSPPGGGAECTRVSEFITYCR
ncbi:MAG: trypsin-like serine protease [Candidatus Aminicenantes bacterium]|nr:trypsin-like serine protease [Candidatus Aminicenantes bacterium]NIM81247.1 trypsin-like serine protease [Candidatus Aminicenantes bacterium]NIN20633.1 trypsin-like serine protease [Candidatus Aminicenantes bacterium]NIN44412.1 trypsin-like serine protease [Candidatus Aminicenantes bacterium]NIN87231.1 trypsin-like serine protease [Candidatus Aminicenantes bacterium]